MNHSQLESQQGIPSLLFLWSIYNTAPEETYSFPNILCQPRCEPANSLSPVSTVQYSHAFQNREGKHSLWAVSMHKQGLQEIVRVRRLPKTYKQ